ncbi:ATP-dependent DNA helicase [Actinomyces sp. 186855]|nr:MULTISPECIES: ATP-dependent DNA helicase [unclassified Actinomyces]MCL3776683.1 ATP-dependent DNA helicase [Actinomyces sp. AC-20-1]MCL3789798.1 ATP-dependent DNA helicase [Actinomyces sp. 187325]MCL3792397.1 ATP-dependent DNA helicase [Actinomyces sp. 186855]MCL3794607.1 ATP-dependent DNA helicase [Actinomyces sp. 217892]
MVRRVAAAVAGSQHLLVQAGTGTGKSLGYLVPAMVHAVTAGERVVVSTATLALQRQVLTKDAPLAADAVEQATGLRPEVRLLKGWQNYMCRHRAGGGYPDDDADTLFSAAQATNRRVGSASTTGVGEQVVRLREWAGRTTTGDRDDLVPGVSDRAWAQVSVSRAECLGSSCPLVDECFPQLARAAAAQADVVVTNHAMLGVAASGNPNVLPEHSVLVVDEAHELADRVRAQGTVTLSAAAVARVAATARAQAGVLVADLEEAGQHLQLALADLPDGRLAEGVPPGLRAALVLLDDAGRQVLAGIREAAKAKGAAEATGAGGLALARTAVADMVEAVERMTSDSVDARRDVAWVERPRMGAEPPRLTLAPVDVAGSVADTLLAGRAAVLTSATLSLGGSFDPMARTLGLTLAEEPWEGLDVGTPFDYARQGILYTPTHLPRPGSGISEAALDEVLALTEASRGGMLGLFSSRRAADEAAEVLRRGTDLTVYAQGDDQLPTLVEAFAADEDACLVGTLSLWQGVDVPGRTCRLVIIDRIPFPRPDDPVAQARSEVVEAAGGNGFMSVSAAHAALLLAQGAGRLVRRSEDRGVVAVLDPRLRTARYGAFLARSMPPLWPTREREVVLGALARLAGQGRERGLS